MGRGRLRKSLTSSFLQNLWESPCEMCCLSPFLLLAPTQPETQSANSYCCFTSLHMGSGEAPGPFLAAHDLEVVLQTHTFMHVHLVLFRELDPPHP